MDVKQMSKIAAAIGEPARARILCSLLDRRARTATELAIVAEVTPSTASVHLERLKAAGLVRVEAQGKHRYFTLDSPQVARALEGLGVLAGQSRAPFTPSTPTALQAARTCYDHIAGTLGVALHDRLREMKWLSPSYDVTASGVAGLAVLRIVLRTARRKPARACLDWSERRPHLAGALGAALLDVAVARRWVMRDLDSRALEVTASGRREMRRHFQLDI